MQQRAFEVLDAAYAAGVRYFDCARSYGLSEVFMRNWLAEQQQLVPGDGQIVIGSKWGYRYVADWQVEVEGAGPHEVKEHTADHFEHQLQETLEAVGRADRPALTTLSRPFLPRFPPFFRRSFALSGFLAPRRRKWAKNGVKWAKNGQDRRLVSSAAAAPASGRASPPSLSLPEPGRTCPQDYCWKSWKNATQIPSNVIVRITCPRAMVCPSPPQPTGQATTWRLSPTHATLSATPYVTWA